MSPSHHRDEPSFPILDAPMPPASSPDYSLPPEGQVKMALLANHLAKREAEMPLRRRIASYLQATGRSASALEAPSVFPIL